MSKKVCILSTSLRENSTSHALALQFAKGAKTAGHEVEVISLIDKTIHFCQGCLSCQKTGRCFLHDDADTIVQQAC